LKFASCTARTILKLCVYIKYD